MIPLIYLGVWRLSTSDGESTRTSTRSPFLRGEYSDRKDLQKLACALRASTERLHATVYAITAVHSLGTVAP